MTNKVHKRKSKIQINILLNSVFSFFISIILTSVLQYCAYLASVAVSEILAYLTVPMFTGIFVSTFFILTRRIVSDLITLEKGLQIISEGDLDYRVPVVRKDELGRVALNINLMAERLQQQIAKEREVERSKMELISGISHDLRTPLTSIIGYIELLRNDLFQSKDEYRRFIQNTFNKAIHLKSMLDDLFEYTRLTSSETRLDLKRINVCKLLEQLLFEFEPIAQENGITVAKKIGNPPIFTLLDSEKIARAIDNLLMNALKYSLKPGTVSINIESDASNAFIAIENKGNPLTPEQENNLFERFYKVDEARSTEGIQTGAGLGLSIARNIIELHGGTLKLNHKDGNFKFILGLPINNYSDNEQ
ncbi:sensor histidine kinase [Paenibacillus sp. Leaf72]|uniref:sensor histidine kinase n=1 Tax=Paenibacillus sp. Leaf72 TaxID=1736234 RepID=UPI000A5ED460|nr:HAMP domain-containing sensor histidine kinase [Paenibacillus sp. Leaf72]